MNYVLSTALEGCSPPYCPGFKPLTAKVILAGWTQDGLHDPWHPMTNIVRDLGWYGMNVVFPVGNEGPTQSNCSSAQTCHFNSFAVGEMAIGVAATPKESDATLEPYSSRGDPSVREERGETFRYEPMLSAPGTGVVAARRPGLAPVAQLPGSNLGGMPHSEVGLERRYTPLTGTSVAAAHVAGTIALMQEAARKASGCYLTAKEVIDILRSTADSMPGYQTHEVGAGALDVTDAVARAMVGGAPSQDPWMCPPAS
jgi:subtilisin family serine protease